LSRAVGFYEQHLGLSVHHADSHQATLGAPGGIALLVLHESPSAPRVRGTTGLYHFAVLVPTLRDLARALLRLIETDTVMQGFADHGVSEALYLADVDGNGIEIYRDRPRDRWPMSGGRLQMVSDPLDLDDLLAELAPGESRGRVAGPDAALIPDGTVIGHVHLHVSHLADAERFYVGILGFDLMQRYGPSALFVSAGGYHHHIGLNTWSGVGASPPPPGAIGLRHFAVRLPSQPALDAALARVAAADLPIEQIDAGVIVRDPARNALVLTTDAMNVHR